MDGEPVPDEYRQRWRAHFQGAPFLAEERTVLYQAFPQLSGTYEDTLWAALDPRASATSFDLGARSVQLDGAPLPFADHNAMETLCGCPHWRRLKYLVVILRSRSERFWDQRAWLHKNFTSFFLLACIRLPSAEMRWFLFELVDNLFEADDSVRCDGWPISRAEFQSFVDTLMVLGDYLSTQRWVLQCGELRLMWLWQLLHKRNARYLQMLIDSHLHHGRPRRPQRLAEAARDALAADKCVKITMEWGDCDP